MTILSDGRERAIECDECPETTDPFDKDDFEQMVATAKKDGWLIVPGSGGWLHKCPGCRGGSALERAQKMFG